MRHPNDDLFEGTKMTFGEHLEELRSALFKSLIAIVVFFVIGLLVSPWVTNWIQVPLRAELETYYEGQDAEKLQELVDKRKAQGEPVPAYLLREGQSEDAEEIRFETVFVDAADIARQLRLIYPDWMPETPPVEGAGDAEADGDAEVKEQTLIPILIGRSTEDDERSLTKSLGIQEPFMVLIKTALVTGAILASPFVFVFIWEFVAAGLYPHEKRYVYVFMPFSLGLFLSGAALAFFVAMRYVLKFLLSFNALMGIDPDPRINEWLGFVLFLPIGFGISFQLPLVMLFLERIGIFSVQSYLEKWRIAVLVVAVVSMLLTPADPTSMVVMAVPLTALYFGGILLCHLMPRRQGPFG